MSSTNVFIPEKPVLGKQPDGRSYLIWPAGKPMLVRDAIKLGLIDTEPKSPLPRPSEIKHEVVEEAETVPATAGAVALAQQYGIDLGQIEGSGNDGRIIKKDVEAFLAEES